MTTNQYIDLFHKQGPSKFYGETLSALYNGEWTIDGTMWYPCVIMDDDVGPGRIKIVTRNQTHAIEPESNVRRIAV